MTLQRLTGKVFAGNADLTDLGVFGSALSGTPTNPTDTNTEAQIQAGSAYEEGWTEAVVTTKNFPPIEEVNGVLRTISYQACYLLQEGIPAWDANTEYSNTSVVKVINGNQLDFYISKQTQSGNTPQTDDGTNWVKAIITSDREIGIPQITLNFNMVLPDGYVDLLGQEESKTGPYSNLYAIYGDNYNNGTESTGNFRFPNFSNRALYGGASVGYINAGVPNLAITTESVGNHTHSISSSGNHTHTTNSAGRHRHGSRKTSPSFEGTGNFVNGGSSSEAAIYTDYADAHTHTISSSGSHSHTTQGAGSHNHIVTVTPFVSGIYRDINTVLTDGIKVRVFTRYK